MGYRLNQSTDHVVFNDKPTLDWRDGLPRDTNVVINEGGSFQLSGPMFEPASHNGYKSMLNKRDGYYNIYHFDEGIDGRVDMEVGTRNFYDFWRQRKPNQDNFVLFSTSGVHGTYCTIEDIETSLKKYPDVTWAENCEPDDWGHPWLTCLIVQPRLVTLRCGVILVELPDVPRLKELRQQSMEAISGIGFD